VQFLMPEPQDRMGPPDRILECSSDTIGPYKRNRSHQGSGEPQLKETIRRLSCSPIARHSYAVASKMPVLGAVLRKLVRSIVPVETRVWIRLRHGLGKGLWAHIDPRFETTYIEGEYERSLQECLLKYLQPGGVLYDVGAHIGIVSMFAAKLVGPTGKVFAFEADPENVRRIEEHIQRNSLGWITIAGLAAWYVDGYVEFQRDSAHSSRNQGGISTISASKNQDLIQVEAISLDTFAEKNRLPTVIKVDVEGAEAEVLRGSERVFARAKPILICEVHGSKPADGVIRWLSDHGYQYQWLETSPQFPRHLVAGSAPETS
jgi:FkbM family methyltransferase